MPPELTCSVVNISPGQYGTLNSLYFFPNIITPLLVGTVAEYLGGPTVCLIAAVFVASIGHTIFAIACQLQSVNLLFIGRILAGCVYEVIDFLPIVCTGALFKDEWGMIVGATNAFLRAGSVATFVIGPFVYQQVGLVPAMWLSAVIALLSVPIAIGAYWLIKQLAVLYQSQSLDSPLSSQDLETQRGFLASPAEVYAKRGRRMSEDCLSPSTRDSRTEPATTLAPFFQLSGTYYLFACAGMLLYGSMVPFWFTGSKYLQEFYGLSVQNAGALILIPEGSIILLSFPLGFLLDNWIKSPHVRLALLGVSTFLLPVGYVLLMTGWNSSSPSPLGSMLTLGFGYGISNCMYWTSLMQIIPEDLIGPGSGLIASSLNVMPAVVPIVAALPVSFASPGDWNLIVLSCLGCMSTLCSLAASYRMFLSFSEKSKGERELSETVGLLNSPSNPKNYEAVSVED
jgi:MFS family permease